MTKDVIFNRRWLNIEDKYHAAGWVVEYDKPAIGDSYKTSFKFIKLK